MDVSNADVAVIRLQEAKKEGALARRSADLAVLLGLLTVYFLAGKLGLMLAFVHASATAVWPPTGIALAGLLVLGYRVWPAIFLGAFLVNITTGGSVATSIGAATGNTLEGLMGTYLVNRFANGRNAFDHPQSVFKFTLLAAVASPAVSAAIGVTSLALGGFASWANYGAIWLTWWLGDATGALIVAPALVLWMTKHDLRWSRAQVFEAALFLVVLVLVGQVVFAGLIPTGVRNYPLSFLCVPAVIWAAFRLGPCVTATATCLLSGIAIWGTLHGLGPFVRDTQNESLIFLQAFLGVIGVVAMAVAAMVAEYGRAEGALREARDELEQRVVERTAELAQATRAWRTSREPLAEAQDIAQIGSWEWDISSNTVSWSDELYRICGLKPDDGPLTRERFLQCVHPDDRALFHEIVERASRDHQPFSVDHWIVRSDGTERFLQGRGRMIENEAGQAVRMIGTAQDVTERKLAEIALGNVHNELENRVQNRTAELTASNIELRHEVSERKRLEKELVEITEKERHRIGRDLHDDLGQLLTGIAFMTRSLKEKLVEASLPEVRDAARIQALVNQAISHARVLSRDLTSAELDEASLSSSLEALAHHVEGLFEARCRFDLQGTIPPLSDGVIRQLFYIAQEAATNAIKHGHAREVWIRLSSAPDHLVVAIGNDGVPFSAAPAANSGLGLRIMKYRADVIGAALEVGFEREGSTVVTCTLPIRSGSK